MSDATTVLGAVTDLVGHLRWQVRPPEPEELRSAELASSPDQLAAAVAATAAGRGSTDAQVLASLWWQAYAYRVAGTTLAAWAVTGAAPGVGDAGTAVGVARSRPASLVVDPAATVRTDLGEVVDDVFAGNLDPVAASLRERHRLGTHLVHGNALAGVASALAAVASAPSAPDLTTAVDEILAALPYRLATYGAFERPGWDHRRTTCCLWWKTTVAGGSLCADCSLRPTPEETSP